MCRFKLVLHVEQPNAGCGGDQSCWKEHKEQGLPATKFYDDCEQDCDGQISAHCTYPVFLLAEVRRRNTVSQKEQIGWTNAKHYDWVAICPVQQAAPATALVILFNRQCHHVADAALIQITCVAVVNRMGAAPYVVWCQC